MSESIPYFDLPAQIRSLRKDLDAAIARTLDNCSFCLGPDVVQFEKDFAKYLRRANTASASTAAPPPCTSP